MNEATSRPSGRPGILQVDFAKFPFTVAWEVTRACALACVHCRAAAIPRRDPGELTTAEAFVVVDQVVDAGRPILVVTGGDPLMRPDLFEILEYAVSRDLRVALSPSATARCTRAAMQRARDVGVSRVHISLDGANAESHDTFRGVRGSFARTQRIIADLRELGLSLQIGTTVSRYSVDQLDEIATLVRQSGAVMWSLFFLVPTGRGEIADMVSPRESEAVMNWLYDLSQDSPFEVRTTAGMHYRRVAIQRRRAAQVAGGPGVVQGAGFSADPLGMSVRGVNDGDGFAFIDHLGNVCPSGFLQIPAGNVRDQSLVDIYRRAPLFRQLRDRTLLRGKCGFCEFREVCGGSRARAYAVYGDYLATDPSCAWIPAGEGKTC